MAGNRNDKRPLAQYTDKQCISEYTPTSQDLTLCLERLGQDLATVTYALSHDVKGALRSTKTVVQWLASDCGQQLDEQGREYLQLLDRRLDRVRALIQGLLDYSQLGHPYETLARVDLNQLISDIEASLPCPDHVMVTIEDNLPSLLFDPKHLQQIFYHLLANAIQFIKTSPGFVKIGCRDDDMFWTFSVSDNGPGIAPPQHERMFKMFQTLLPSEQTNRTGVGLAIVRKIIDTYSGQIWVESEPGEGTTIFFSLPKEPRDSHIYLQHDDMMHD